MASIDTWAKLKHFRPDSPVDNWGDPDEIDDFLLLSLDDFRRSIGVPIFVTSGVATKGHSSKSYHYRENGACAVDVVIPGYPEGPIDLVLEATRFGFTGIGWYPHWKYQGETVGGLHLDLRPLKLDPDGTINYRHNRWIGLETGEYIPMNYRNLKLYGEKYGLG